jgi:hypothetical protein
MPGRLFELGDCRRDLVSARPRRQWRRRHSQQRCGKPIRRRDIIRERDRRAGRLRLRRSTFRVAGNGGNATATASASTVGGGLAIAKVVAMGGAGGDGVRPIYPYSRAFRGSSQCLSLRPTVKIGLEPLWLIRGFRGGCRVAGAGICALALSSPHPDGARRRQPRDTRARPTSNKRRAGKDGT